jgi:hypothetical protein
MIAYMKHILWLLIRPFVRPFWLVRQQPVEERMEELARYDRERRAALNELKIELLLAHRQGVRDHARQQQEESPGA